MEGRWGGLLLALFMVTTASSTKLEYSITSTWNGGAINHDPVNLTLTSTTDKEYLLLEIKAPFFNDPPSPTGKPGEPFFGLWNYEVVEAFFLNDENQYVEIEVCPWGQHIVLLLSGQRVTIRHSLPLDVTTTRKDDVWTGTAKIPVSYLPPNVTKFNAYGIHGSDPNRIYESLYPADETAANPDFHALQYFQPIDLSGLLPDFMTAPMSQLWTDSLEGLFRYKITTTWDDKPLTSSPVEFTLQGFEAGVELNVTAPFYNDPAPNGTAGKPFYGLWDYEVVEMFFLNDNDEYLEVELGPWGEHLLLLLKGQRNTIKHSLDLDYIITSRTNPTDGSPGEWKGSAMIPPSYFPPNVSRMNAYAIHGVDEAREYQSLYPAPQNNPDYLHPDFHRLDLFQPIDFEYQVKDNKEYSDVWLDAMASSAVTRGPSFEAETEVAMTELGPMVGPTELPTSIPPTVPTTEAATNEVVIDPEELFTTVQPAYQRTLEPSTIPPTVQPTVPPTVEPTDAVPRTEVMEAVTEIVDEMDVGTRATPVDEGTEPSVDEPLTRTPPQPQKVDLSDIRIHRVDELPQSRTNPQTLESRPVPEPELLIISRGSSKHIGLQSVSQRGSQGLKQRPPIRIQGNRPQTEFSQRRKPTRNQGRPQTQFLHGERPVQGQVNSQRGQVQFQTRGRPQVIRGQGQSQGFRPQTQVLRGQTSRRPQGQGLRGQGQFQSRVPQGQVFPQGQFQSQGRPQRQGVSQGQLQGDFQGQVFPQGQGLQEDSQDPETNFQGQFEESGVPGTETGPNLREETPHEKAIREELERREAELEARREEQKRREAELVAREEEAKRREAGVPGTKTGPNLREETPHEKGIREELERREAELEARREEQKRREAELVAREEEAKRREAEEVARREELERREAAKIAREEEEKRREADLVAREEESQGFRPQTQVLRGQTSRRPQGQGLRGQGQFQSRFPQGQVFPQGQFQFQGRPQRQGVSQGQFQRNSQGPQGQGQSQDSQGQFQGDFQGQVFPQGQEDSQNPETNFQGQFEESGVPGTETGPNLQEETPHEKAIREELERREAELEARREEQKRREAELVAREEEAKRREAEEVARREELERREAAKIAREEEAKRREADLVAREEEADLIAKEEEAATREAVEIAMREELERREAEEVAREAELITRGQTELEAARKAAAEKEAAEVAQREEIARREEEEVARREEIAIREEEEAARREEIARREEVEAAQREEIAIREAEEAARREEVEAARREEIAIREEEEAARREEIARREEVEAARRAEIAIREAEEAVRREEIARREEAEAARREAAQVASLAEGSPALPPSHPTCFQEGLVADSERCWVFHECVLEGGEWEMYSWKCMRGHVFDEASTSCVRGRCRRRFG